MAMSVTLLCQWSRNMMATGALSLWSMSSMEKEWVLHTFVPHIMPHTHQVFCK